MNAAATCPAPGDCGARLFEPAWRWAGVASSSFRLPAVIVALLLLGAVAGCLGKDGDGGAAGGGEPAGSGTPSVLAPKLSERVSAYAFDGGLSQGESFISVSPDGQTLLTCTHGGLTRPSPSVVSEDGGATWRQVAFPLGVGVGGDCETALMPNGTWVFLSSTIMDNTLITTSDKGKTFTWNANAGFGSNGMADRPWVEAAGDRLLLTFMPLSPTPGWIGYTYSDDKAATWTETAYITQWDESRVGVMHGHIQVHADQERVWVPLIKYDQPSSASVGVAPVTGTLGYAYSDDAGLTWREEVLFGPMGLHKTPATMAVAGDRLYYAALVLTGGGGTPDPVGLTTDATYDLQVWVSNDTGRSWSDPVVVKRDMPPDTTWIDGAADGTATMLVQPDGEVFGYEPGRRVIGLRLDADIPGLLAYTQDFGLGGNEFVTVDHDARSLAYVSYADSERVWVVHELAD